MAASLSERDRSAFRALTIELLENMSEAKLALAVGVSQQAINKAKAGSLGIAVARGLASVAKMTYDEVVQRYGGDAPAEPPVSSPRPTERYPSRSAVLVAAAAAGFSEGARATVATLALKADEDPGDDFWWDRLRFYEKRIAEEARGLAKLRSQQEAETFDVAPVRKRR